MRRLLLLSLTAVGLAYPQTPTAAPFTRLTFGARWDMYAKRTYTDPWRHIRLLGEVAADDFAFGGVKKWGSGLSGYGKSLGTVYGQRVISNTIELFAGAAIGDDARYRPSTSSRLVVRGLHALGSTFTARDRNGHTGPAYSRILAVTGAYLIANQWRPFPNKGGRLGTALIFNVTDAYQGNLEAEFGPDAKKFGAKLWRKIHPVKPRTRP